MDEVISKPEKDYKDDLRQAMIVSKYEVMKFVSGKKIYIFAILEALVLGLLAVVMFFFSNEGFSTKGGLATYISFISLLMLVGATLFSSVTLVSEFEERTSFMLFTKPIRKSSIFIGKFLAAYVLNLLFVIAYYAISAILVAIKTGGSAIELLPSLGYCAAYIFALTGIAILFSSLMKKSSSASILTFVFILLVPSIVVSIVAIATGSVDVSSYWYILDVAEASVPNAISGSVENGARDFFVMILWGLIPAIGAYILFKRREV